MTTAPVCRDEDTVGCGRLRVSMTEKDQVLRVDGPFGFESNILKMGMKCWWCVNLEEKRREEEIRNWGEGRGGLLTVCSLCYDCSFLFLMIII